MTGEINISMIYKEAYTESNMPNPWVRLVTQPANFI